MSKSALEEPGSPVRGERAPDGATAGPARRADRRTVVVCALIVLALLGQMAFVMITAARGQSATADEPVYVGAAVYQRQEHSFKYNFEHPPLAKQVMSIALSAGADPKFGGKAEWGQYRFGAHVLYTAGNDADELLFLARLSIIILTLLFGLVVFFFGRDLAGPAGGLVALALYAFSPDVIANGSLATMDMPFAGFLITAAWLLWRARRRPMLYLPLAAVAGGAALATKMTALFAMPIFAALAFLSWWHADSARAPRARALRGLAVVAGFAVLAVATVWAVYLSVNPQIPWNGDPQIKPVHGLKGLITDWLPLPRPYRDGMRLQFNFEGIDFAGFMFGETYTGSRWYFLPVALLVKTPIGALVLWLAGAAALALYRPLRAASLYVTAPAVLLLASAMTGNRDLGVRYALFVPVFLAVAAGAVLLRRARWVQVATAVLVLFAAVSSLRTFPHYLPYSNEAFGGPEKTSELLYDSSSDWGQDLKGTGEWLRERYPDQPVWLSYHGGGQAGYYGIPVPKEQGELADWHGLVVFSDSRLQTAGQETRDLLAQSREVGRVGHSMTIFLKP